MKGLVGCPEVLVSGLCNILVKFLLRKFCQNFGFRIIDADESGEISVDEFVSGCMQLEGELLFRRAVLIEWSCATIEETNFSCISSGPSWRKHSGQTSCMHICVALMEHVGRTSEEPSRGKD